MVEILKFIEDLKLSLQKFKVNITETKGMIFLECEKNNLINTIKIIKEDNKLLYSQLTDMTAVDHINDAKRFELIYLFLSHKFNFRLAIKVFLEEKENIESICSVFESANWYERECYDLFGIIFKNHPDLRRIMTDYGFVGHPLRKDFPLTGHTEVRYDNLQKKVVYEPVKLQQEYRNFDYSSPWEGFIEKIEKDKNILSDKENETD